MTPRPAGRATASLGQHAQDQLQFIRQTMERSSTFTAVPGWGGAGMGAIGIGAAMAAAAQPSTGRWLMVWLSAAAAAMALGGIAMWRKARRGGASLTGVVGHRFAIGLGAPLAAGAGTGFGGLQLAFGLYIAGRHGG